MTEVPPRLSATVSGRTATESPEIFELLELLDDAMFAAMWEQSKKMDDPDVFRTALVESRLDADRLLARIQDAAVKEKLIANTQRAFERGAFGIPTFFVGDEIYFGKDRLRDVEEEIVAPGR